MKTTPDGTAGDWVSPGTREARGEVLVSPEWLADHLYDPDLRVIEVDVSSAAYADWHIDGAVLWNVYQDLRDPDYRLADATAFEGLLVRSGIRPESTVVFYGYAPALGFWLMTLFGHTNALILDCSRDTWRAGEHPWSDIVAEPTSANYRLGGEDHRLRADQAAVRDAIGRSDARLVDVRSMAEYRGERFWPSGAVEPNGRAGHVPSAIHQPIDGLYDERGGFRAIGELRHLFSPIDIDIDIDLITYCTVGGRAATAWFVLTYLLGRDHVRVYDGSWAEWGHMADAPVDAS